MIMLLMLNLVLAAVYLALSGSTSFLNIVLALIVGYIIVGFYARAAGKSNYMVKVYRLGKFACYFVYILIKANLDVAREILTPGYQMSPRIIKYFVGDLSEVQTTTLANAITLTPGTLTADIDEDSQYLYIHAMYAKNRDDAVADLDELKGWLMREVFTP